MISPLIATLALSREPTPTPTEQNVLRSTEKDLATNLAANQDFYASRLEEISHSINPVVSEAISQNLGSAERPIWFPSAGDASPDKEFASLNMSQRHSPPTSPDPGKSSAPPSRRRSRSQAQPNSARRYQGRSSLQVPNLQSFSITPSSSAADISASASTSQPQPLPPVPQYQSPPYGQTSGYVGPYTVSNPPSMNLLSNPYPYAHHSFNRQDIPQNTHLGYSPSSMVPMMQPQMYSYQSHASDGTPSATSHSFSAGSSSLYTRMNPSPPPHSPPPNHGPGGPPHPAPYTSQTAFSPMRFSTPSHFPYAGQSYPSTNMYPSTYLHASYPQQYATEQDPQRGWWYMLPGSHSTQFDSIAPPYHQGRYPIQFAPITGPEVESYSHAGLYSQSPLQQHQPQFSLPQPVSEAQTHPSPPKPLPPVHTGPAECPKPDPVVPSPTPKERSPPVRRPYHPNPPSQRSEWVMWAGNVPSDATHDELRRFFSRPPNSDPSTSSDHSGGVSSIFLISRSNCAFVNFDSEERLQAAIVRFTGQQVRPDDPKCPRLVCRVRRKDDDLRAGVGGQRGVGLHGKWVQQQKGKAFAKSPDSDLGLRSEMSPSGDLASSLVNVSISSDEDGNANSQNPSAHSNSSGSYASTSSGMLSTYFPKRYFILKSLTQFDLDLSVETGYWATQRHNEGILDQAFRTSTDVYLIFGVNKSGEFYGYARMAGPISRNETKVAWASRTDSPPSSRSSQSPLASRDSLSSRQNNFILSPAEKRFSDNSPLPVTPESGKRLILGHTRPGTNSAPAELHQMHRKFTFSTPEPQTSLDQLRVAPAALPEGFHLDESAPIAALRHPPRPKVGDVGSLETISEPVMEMVSEEDERPVQEGEGSKGKNEETADQDASWGEPFKIEWIHTDRLPFYRTRHLRNPWNHDREIKVSRDGTELEPDVGQALLVEWDRVDPSPAPPAPSRLFGGPRRELKNPTTTASSSPRGKKVRDEESG